MRVKYSFCSGDVALDFVGTLQHRRSDQVERLATPEALARWVLDAGLLDAEPVVTLSDLDQARQLREAIYRLALGQGADSDRDIVNAAAAHPPATPRLTATGVVVEGTLPSVLSDLARAAIRLLAGSSAVKECEGPECTRLILDTSRRGSRRWCDMRECGNRSKVAAYRARRAPA